MTRVQLNDLQRRWLAEIGVDSVLLRHFAAPEPAAVPTPSARPALSARPARVQRAAAAEVEAPEAPAAPVPAPAPEDLPDTLEALHYHALRCERCELHRQRHQLVRSEEHTSELQSRGHLVCRLLLEKKKITTQN